MYSMLSVFAVKNSIRNNSHHRLKPPSSSRIRKKSAPANERHVCAVGEHLLHLEPPVCAVGDHSLLDSKKEHVKEPLQTTQHELTVNASEQAGFLNTIDIGQCFRRRLVCDTDGRCIASYRK